MRCPAPPQESPAPNPRAPSACARPRVFARGACPREKVSRRPHPPHAPVPWCAQHIRNSAHARFDCVICKFPSDPKNNVEECKKCCDNCWCWVCDEKKCQGDWSKHCLCDGSPEWAVERAKIKRRQVNAASGAASAANDSEERVNARFAQAQNVANGGNADGPMSDAEAQLLVNEVFSGYSALLGDHTALLWLPVGFGLKHLTPMPMQVRANQWSKFHQRCQQLTMVQRFIDDELCEACNHLPKSLLAEISMLTTTAVLLHATSIRESNSSLSTISARAFKTAASYCYHWPHWPLHRCINLPASRRG